jgi:hypothetical protein
MRTSASLSPSIVTESTLNSFAWPFPLLGTKLPSSLAEQPIVILTHQFQKSALPRLYIRQQGIKLTQRLILSLEPLEFHQRYFHRLSQQRRYSSDGGTT